MESRLRNALKKYYQEGFPADDIVAEIDEIIGEETGRGFESDFSERKEPC